MKKIAIYAVAAMLAISGAANVAAATDDVGPELTYNEKNENSIYGEVIISGNLVGVEEGQLISITVYERNKGVTNGLKWYDQAKAGKDGKYEFKCTLEGEEEGTEYIFAVAAEGHPGEAELFTYYKKATANSVVANLTSAAAVADAITNYDTFFQLDTSVYEGLTPSGQSYVCTNTVAELKKLKDEGTTPSVADFAEVLADCCNIEAMNEITDDAEYKEKLVALAEEKAPAVVEIFEDLATADGIVTEMNKTGVRYNSASALMGAFNDKVLSTAANDAQVVAEMQNIVTTTAKEIGIDLTEFNELSVAQQTAVMSTMLTNNSYRSCTDIKNAFDAAINPYLPGSNVAPDPGFGVGAGVGAGAGSGTGVGSGNLTPMPAPVVTVDPFKDMESVNWARSSVNKLYLKGVVSGDENGNFNPNNNVTRAEYVKMLVSAMDMIGLGTGLSFDDVNSDAWYHDYVIAAAENELVSGMTETSFGPNLPITRQDAAVIIYRAAGIKNINLDAVNDAKIADESEIAGYAKDAVKALFASELLNGVGGGRFAPKDNMTRAQAAVIMCSFLERLEALN